MNSLSLIFQLYLKSNGYWIGYNTLNRDKDYQWTDGSPTNFTNWNTGQPDNYNNVEECAEIRSNQLWNDVNCYLNKGWMCTILKGVVPPAQIIVPPSFPGKKLHLIVILFKSF